MIFRRLVRNYSTSVLELLKTKTKATNYQIPQKVQVKPTKIGNFSDNFVKFKNSKEFKQKPIRTLPKQPVVKNDIKGIDETAFQYIYKSKKVPNLISCKFFNMRFYPKNHTLSRYRKLNLACAFSNKGGFNLNDQDIEKNIANYKGEYRSHQFFSKITKPLDASFTRTRYRKYMRQLVFNLVKDLKSNDFVKLEGIFQFQFITVPSRQEDYEFIDKSVTNGIKKLIEDVHLQRKLLSLCNQDNNGMRIKQDVLRANENYLHVKSIHHKLPFLNS